MWTPALAESKAGCGVESARRAFLTLRERPPVFSGSWLHKNITQSSNERKREAGVQCCSSKRTCKNKRSASPQQSAKMVSCMLQRRRQVASVAGKRQWPQGESIAAIWKNALDIMRQDIKGGEHHIRSCQVVCGDRQSCMHCCISAC